MPRWIERPAVAVPVLIACAAAAVFPLLGGTSLWDDDEGRNAGCTREMIEVGTWIVPTFNGELRTAKPVLLYWLMRPAFELCGENEFAARLPSAVCFVATVLVVYALGRRMFGGAAGFLGGVIAASTIGLVYLGRGSLTDAPLILFVSAYFWAFWRIGVELERWMWAGLACGVAAGLAVLTKGPAVGLVLPVGGVAGFAVWRAVASLRAGQPWGRSLVRLAVAWWPAFLVAVVLTAGPWYGLVSAETKGEWPRAFFLKDNVSRASEAMEGHSGIPVLYELGVVIALFAPWSSFLGITLWTAFRSREPEANASNPNALASGSRLLLCWAGVFFLACAAAATKLPHYVAPVYPALALLTGRFLARWMSGDLTPPRWIMPVGLSGFALTGLVVAAGLLLASGAIPLPSAKMRTFPGLERWAWVGLFPLASAVVGGWFLRKGNRPAVIGSLVIGTVLFVATLAAFAPPEVDKRKAVKALVSESGARVLDREARVASLDYHQPSITFYTARSVERKNTPAEAAEFLAFDIESYLFVPEPLWDNEIAPLVRTRVRKAATHYDFYRNCNVVVVTNR